jgi:hypothetical protein
MRRLIFISVIIVYTVHIFYTFIPLPISRPLSRILASIRIVIFSENSHMLNRSFLFLDTVVPFIPIYNRVFMKNDKFLLIIGVMDAIFAATTKVIVRRCTWLPWPCLLLLINNLHLIWMGWPIQIVHKPNLRSIPLQRRRITLLPVIWWTSCNYISIAGSRWFR